MAFSAEEGIWVCRVCFGMHGGLGTGAHGCCISLPHPEKPGVCARGHPWHNPVHAVDGCDIRPGPQRHSARRAGFLMRCRVPRCINPHCSFAHSESELVHWRRHRPPPADHRFHPRVVALLREIDIPLPVTDNISEKINALALGAALHRLMRLKLAKRHGFAALLTELKRPPLDMSLFAVQPVKPPDGDVEVIAPPPLPIRTGTSWDPLAWRQWEAGLGRWVSHAALVKT